MPESTSWVIIERGTGKVVCEIFSRKTVQHLNKRDYRAVPIHEYLPKLNAAIKANGGAMPDIASLD